MKAVSGKQKYQCGFASEKYKSRGEATVHLDES